MKSLRGFVFSLVALFAGCASESPAPAPDQSATAVQQACKDPHVQCGDQPILISLHLSDGHSYKQTLQPPIPLVQYDHVYLFPGQTLYIEADVQGDKLTNLHMVPTVVHPEKTLVLEFEQSGGNGGEGMMFSIQQPFDRMLKYHAEVMDLDATPRILKQTSTCPVVPKGSGFETWPEPITQLVVSDFHFVDSTSNAARMCD